MNTLSRLFDGLKLIIQENAQNIAHHRNLLALAESPCHDDLYIVSFPKSGATWMDFLMANVHLRMSGDKRSVNFYNVHNFIPDIHYSRNVRNAEQGFPGFRIMKSHSGLNPFYKNVVYVIRDPRDVMVSYFNFLRGLGQFPGNISELIRSAENGILAWVNHVNGWWKHSSAALPFFVVQYERLKTDPLEELKRFYAFLGFDIPADILRSAIEASSFERMREMEAELNYGGRPIGEGFLFMRKGKSGEWASEIGEDDHAFILDIAGPVMASFNYR